MEQPTIGQNKEGIKAALKQSFHKVATMMSQLSEEQCHFKSGEKWTPAENLSHLILSTYPIASALNKSKMMFRVFGTSSNGSRSYDEMCSTYLEALKNPINLTGTNYEPKQDAAADVNKMLENWKVIHGKLETRLDKWSESDLDKYRVPHPLLGKLTFREVLFFTNWHNLLHLDIIQQRLSEHGEI